MEEKERYKLESYHEAFCEIHDTESDEWYLRKDLVTDLLNQQDKRIKELEEELVKQKEKYDYLYDCYKKTSSEDLQDKYRLAEENQQLKQQLHDLPNQIVGEIKNYINNHSYLIQVNSKNRKVVYNISLVRFLETILKKHGGEDDNKRM